MRWRTDGRCGASFPLRLTEHGSVMSECDPTSDKPCCSDYGYCGNSPSHCTCSSCVDYRNEYVNIVICGKYPSHFTCSSFVDYRSKYINIVIVGNIPQIALALLLLIIELIL